MTGCEPRLSSQVIILVIAAMISPRNEPTSTVCNILGLLCYGPISRLIEATRSHQPDRLFDRRHSSTPALPLRPLRSGRLLTIESRRGALRQPLDAISRWLQHLAWRGATERAYRILCAGASSRNVGVAIDLISSAPQAGHAIAVYVALPCQELIDGDVIDAARFFDAAHDDADRYNHPALKEAYFRLSQASKGCANCTGRCPIANNRCGCNLAAPFVVQRTAGIGAIRPELPVSPVGWRCPIPLNKSGLNDRVSEGWWSGRAIARLLPQPAGIGIGIGISLASCRRLWAVAARWNSSRAPFGPRNRSRSSFRMRLRCANSISTFLR